METQVKFLSDGLNLLMVALAVAAFGVASAWPLEAQQNGSKFSIHDSGPSNGLRDVQLKEFRYTPIAASEPQKQAGTAAAGGKGAAEHSSLAETATNPIGNLIQFQLQNVFIPTSWDASGYSNQFIIQPVVPINLHNKIFPTLITRTTLPIVTTPDPDGPIEGTTGSGDMVFLTAFVNNQKWGMWGLGPTFTFPTASDSRTGSEKWQVGPAAIVFVTKFHPWQFGALTFTQHSFAGTSARSTVSKLFYQPILLRHFSKGWYAGLPDITSTTDFRTGENTIAFTGLRAGRVTKIGKLPLNLFLQSWYTPVHDGAVGKWNIKFSLTFLFPK